MLITKPSNVQLYVILCCGLENAVIPQNIGYNHKTHVYHTLFLMIVASNVMSLPLAARCLLRVTNQNKKKKKRRHFIAYLLWHLSMQIIVVLYVEILSLRFIPPPKNNGGDWIFVCDAQALENYIWKTQQQRVLLETVFQLEGDPQRLQRTDLVGTTFFLRK